MVEKLTFAIEDFVKLSKERMNAVVRQSTQDIIDIAQKPVAKGGKMRVDTGFLRASGQISFSGMPTGPTMKPSDAQPGSFAPAETVYVLQISKFKIGETIYFGWTANYAKYREVYDGFLVSAIKMWPMVVMINARKVQK